MTEEIGTIKLTRTDNGVRIDISGDLAKSCCCCSDSVCKCDCDCCSDTSSKEKSKKD